MKENIVRRMHLVLGAGLDLLERLDRGETPRFEAEHSNIQALIVAGGELDYDPTYRGEIANMMGRNSLSGDAGSFFLGVQYALACWLDEMFIMQSPQFWRDQWSEASIEVALYGGTQQRAWRFWDQARRAEGPKGSPEALESYLWCVMLGFQGEPTGVQPPINPPVWVDNVRKRALAGRGNEFPMPAQRDPPTDVPPLRGSERLIGMLRWMVVVVAIVIFGAAILLTYSFTE